MFKSNLFHIIIGLFIVQHLICIISSENSCGSGNWIKYRDEKCLVFIDKLVTQPEARELCRAVAVEEQLQRNAVGSGRAPAVELISIHSSEEQSYVNEYLQKINVEDSVWIDLVMRYDDQKQPVFESSDGDLPSFDNWALNRPTGDPKRRCVQMRGPIELKDRTLDSQEKMFSSGKWEDVVCYKKNYVLCQKFVELTHQSVLKALFKTQTQLNQLTKAFVDYRQRNDDILQRKLMFLDEEFHSSKDKFGYFETKLDAINNKTDVSLREIAATEFYIKEFVDNPVPLGFIYVQLPGQPEPAVLWPTVKWSNISDKYSGLFFRVFGNNSDPFSEIQADSGPRLTGVVTQVKQKTANKNFNEQLRPNDKWSKDLYTGSDGGSDNYYMSFKVSSGEVRPRNTAVYVWKRTQ